MIAPVIIPALFGLAGHALSENAEKRVWTGALARRAQRMRTGKTVKNEPLPPGRYWIDIFPDGIPTWVAWSGGNLATVQVEKTEWYEGTTKLETVLGWIYPWVPTPTNPTKEPRPDRAWIIFTVSAPTVWGVADKIGWPNTAPKGVIETSNDTVTKPDPYKEQEDALSWVKPTAIAAVVVVGLVAVSRLVRG